MSSSKSRRSSASLTPQMSAYSSRMEMSIRLLRSLKTLTLPNLVTPVRRAKRMYPSSDFRAP